MSKTFFAGVALTLTLVLALSIFGFASDGFDSGLDSNVALEGSATENSIVAVSDKDEVVNTPQSSSGSSSDSGSSGEDESEEEVAGVGFAFDIDVDLPEANYNFFTDENGYAEITITAPSDYLDKLANEGNSYGMVLLWPITDIIPGGDGIAKSCSFRVDGEELFCEEGINIISHDSYLEDFGNYKSLVYEISIEGSAFRPRNYEIRSLVYDSERGITYPSEVKILTILDRNRMGDVNADGYTDKTDLEIVKYLFGRQESGRADVNGDGMVTFADITELLANWS